MRKEALLLKEKMGSRDTTTVSGQYTHTLTHTHTHTHSYTLIHTHTLTHTHTHTHTLTHTHVTHTHSHTHTHTHTVYKVRKQRKIVCNRPVYVDYWIQARHIYGDFSRPPPHLYRYFVHSVSTLVLYQ